MPIPETLNIILKEMWRLDEKISSGGILTNEEQKFYIHHLQTIKEYYETNNSYWQSKKNIA